MDSELTAVQAIAVKIAFRRVTSWLRPGGPRDGTITGSRRRMLAQLRAGAVEEASAEMGNHLRVLTTCGAWPASSALPGLSHDAAGRSFR